MLRRAMTLAAIPVLLTACSESSPTGPESAALVVRRNANVAAPKTEPGVPGASNCKGQSTAYVAQEGKTFGEDFRGLAGAAAFFDLTVQDAQTVINEFCAGE